MNGIITADMTQKALYLANSVMQKAYAPYSNFHVGAVILGNNGNLYQGCNIENASYPQGICAEGSAIANMVSDGCRVIKAVWVMGKGEKLVTPCGSCRQRIRELVASLQVPIMICCPHKGVRLTTTLEELLPYSFGHDNLL